MAQLFNFKKKSMAKRLTKIGYMDSCRSKTMKRLTPEALETLTTSFEVNSTMRQIEAEADQEMKSKLKGDLPVVLYARAICLWCSMLARCQRMACVQRLRLPFQADSVCMTGTT